MDVTKQAEEKIVSALQMAGYHKSDTQPFIDGCIFVNSKPDDFQATHADLLIRKVGRDKGWVRLRYSDLVEVWAKQIAEDFTKDGN